MGVRPFGGIRGGEDLKLAGLPGHRFLLVRGGCLRTL
jgi:hypothetical protein